MMQKHLRLLLLILAVGATSVAQANVTYSFDGNYGDPLASTPLQFTVESLSPIMATTSYMGTNCSMDYGMSTFGCSIAFNPTAIDTSITIAFDMLTLNFLFDIGALSANGTYIPTSYPVGGQESTLTVSGINAVPEPTSIALLGLGFLGLGLMRRHKSVG